ncbi:MAG: YfhO family protein [Oscillospiraceae bacterium]|nr:YfhO family protein [Oscillospiraceae bacterium]
MVLNKKILYPIAAFLLPFTVITLAFVAFGIYPFGIKTILTTDMSMQYIEFYGGLRNLLSQGNLIYSFNLAMGMPLTGLFAYYLSSPFSLIVLLFPKAMITEAVTLIIILKLASCGLTFYFLLKYYLKERFEAIHLVFCLFYALMGYTTAFYFSPMWFDALIYLPLLVIELHKIMKGKSALMFILCLTASLFSGFYTTVFALIFLAIYFLYQSYCSGFKGFLKQSLKLLWVVVVPFALTAFFLIPAILQMAGSYGFNSEPVSAYTAPWFLLERMLPASYSSFASDGTANVYSGFLCLLLLPIYFFNKNVTKRQKIGAAAVLGFLILSMCVWKLGYVWQGFRPAIYFNFRFSFVLSFFVIFLCAQVVDGLNEISLRVKIPVLCTMLIFLAFVQFKGQTHPPMVLNLVLLAGYAAYLIWGSALPKIKHFKHIAVAVVFLLASLETGVNAYTMMKGAEKLHKNDERDFFRWVSGSVSAAADNIKSLDPPTETNLYRTETDMLRSSNQGLAAGYNSLSVFASVTNEQSLQDMGKLGILYAYKNLAYYGSTEVIDSIWGIRYKISMYKREQSYEKINTIGELNIYKNPNALPLMFPAREEILGYSCTPNDPFEAQNELVNALCGGSKDVFLPENSVELTPFDEELNFTINAQAEGYLYFYADIGISTAPVYINGVLLGRDNDMYTRGIIACGYRRAGESLTLTIKDKPSRLREGSARSRTIDLQALEQAMSKLKPETQPVFNSSSSIKYDVNIEEGELIFTTIPYANGWKAVVDGKPAEIEKTMDGGFIAVKVPVGRHTMQLSYFPPGLALGIVISALALVVFVVKYKLISYIIALIKRLAGAKG